MLAKLKYGFLCDGAFQVQGKYTYQGVFDRIHAVQFPAIHPSAVLAFRFSGPVGVHLLRIQLTDSTGKMIGQEVRQPIECREFIDNDVALTINGLPIPAPGFYTFKLFLDEDGEGREPFGVIEYQALKLKPPKNEPERE